MLVVYDGGDHADMVLRTASWLEHSGKFNVIVLSVKRKDERPNEDKPTKEEDNQPRIRKKSGLNSRKSKFRRLLKTPLKSMPNLFHLP